LPITRLFTSAEAAREVIRRLESNGVDPRSISVLTRQRKEADSLEQQTGASDDLEDVTVRRGRLQQFVDWLGQVESAAVPGFGAVLGTGNLWQDVQVAGNGRGAITGALVGAGVPVDTASNLEEAVTHRGQILVVVHGDYDESDVNAALPPSE